MSTPTSTALVMYVPVLHASYLALFDKYKGKADVLYILGDEIIDQFPRVSREIRPIKPEVMKELLAQRFPKVEIANARELTELAANKSISIVTTDEVISDIIKDQYFSGRKITQESFFLRYDEKVVAQARQQVEFTGQITTDDFHWQVFKKLDQVKQKSSDWFLRVAAAVVVKDEIIAIDYNQRMPTPYSMWSLGDPRNYMEYGTDTHQRTTLHAEQAVIAYCAKNGLKMQGSDFYVNVFPCPDCSQVISQTGVKRLFFKEGFSSLSSDEVLKLNDIEIININ